MSIIAAFLWNKSPHCSISTMIIDDENIEFLSPAKIHYLPKDYYNFRKSSKNIIKEFNSLIEHLYKIHQKRITIEFKIVFHAQDIPYLLPAKESKFVYNTFIKLMRRTKRRFKLIRIQPQLRRRLFGKQLKDFKHELRTLHLVSRKKSSGFEYHLWTVALHATPANYAAKLKQIRNKLTSTMWSEAFKIL